MASRMKFYPENIEAVNQLKHYSLKRVFSFKCRYIYLIGGRGYGKTYSVKSFVINQFVKHGHKFAWVRTSDTALKKIRNPSQFFGRLENLKQLGVESYDIKNDIIYINGKEAGYLFAVSTFHNIKGADYRCKYSVYDEFMRAKRERSFQGRREMYFDLTESIFRDADAIAFCISNSTNKYDEMLEPFDLNLNEFGCYLFRQEKAVVHYIQPSKRHIEEHADNLSFAGMTEQERKMAVKNEFTSFGDYGKMEKAQYIFTLQVDDNKFLNLFQNNGKIYVKASLQPMNKLKTTYRDYVTSAVPKLSKSSHKRLKDMFDSGEVLFEGGYARESFKVAVNGQ